MGSVQSLRGFKDSLPPESESASSFESLCRGVLGRYGFREIRLPTLELQELFIKSTGETTDIVEKEMFRLEDAGGRRLALRPEGTPGVVRAYLEHGLSQKGGACKLFYVAPMFRAERPQAGRLREFVQVGVECLGNPHPAADAEAILAAKAVFEEAGLSGRTALRLNNLGCDDDPSCRPAHREALRAFLVSREADLCENCRRRTQRNPLRALDCKGCGPSLADQAPRLIPCAACAGHVQEVSRFLLANGCPHRYPDHGLVRGLDYYTRTVFEFSCSLGTGSQDALAAGGRYDGLVGSMGGPKTPAVGWALGLERVLMAVRAAHPPTDSGKPPGGPSIDAFVALQGKGSGAVLAAVNALEALRRAGLKAGGSAFGASLKAQMREASREEAPFVAIIGDEELQKTPPACTLKDMRAGTQAEVALDSLAELLLRETRRKGE